MVTIFHLNFDQKTSRDDQRVLLMSGNEANHGDLAEEALTNGLYTKVATVDTDDLEVALRLTDNDYVGSWSLAPHSSVKVLAPLHEHEGKTYGRKSTYVGDILSRNGDLYVVANVGFVKLGFTESELYHAEDGDPLGDWHGRNE